jgi:hypothetical protein
MTTHPRAHVVTQSRISSHQQNNHWFRSFSVSMFSLILGIAWLLIAPTTASAHAEYVSSDPAMNAIWNLRRRLAVTISI